MIVVTGPAGGATSFVSTLYRALGFDAPERRGLEVPGTEDRSVLRLNLLLAEELGAAGRRRRGLDLVRWERVGPVAERHGPAMRALAEQRQVAQDPRFCWTMAAWLGAEAAIDHIVLPLPPPEISARSVDDDCYGLGLLLAAAVEHRVPVTTLRFPDLLGDPAELCRVLPLPRPRSSEEFHRAFAHSAAGSRP